MSKIFDLFFLIIITSGTCNSELAPNEYIINIIFFIIIKYS